MSQTYGLYLFMGKHEKKSFSCLLNKKIIVLLRTKNMLNHL